MIDDRMVHNIQTRLPIILLILGMNGPSLAKELGMSKQSISNIIHEKTKLTKSNALAILYVVDHTLVKISDLNTRIAIGNKLHDLVYSYDLSEEYELILKKKE